MLRLSATQGRGWQLNSSRETEVPPDMVYINDDNNLENLRYTDQTWKVRMIDREFKRLMYDREDV